MVTWERFVLFISGDCALQNSLRSRPTVACNDGMQRQERPAHQCRPVVEELRSKTLPTRRPLF